MNLVDVENNSMPQGRKVRHLCRYESKIYGSQKMGNTEKQMEGGNSDCLLTKEKELYFGDFVY